MTDVMPEQAVDLDVVLGREPVAPADEALDEVDEQLIARLAGKARSGGLPLTGEGGLLAQLTKRLVESALEAIGRFHRDRSDARVRDAVAAVTKHAKPTSASTIRASLRAVGPPNDDLADYIAKTHNNTVYHPACTARIGPDGDPDAVMAEGRRQRI